MHKTMKAARLFAPNDLRIDDIAIPETGPYDVLCRVLRAGICTTDYAIYSGHFSFIDSGDVRFPMTPGHEWAGIVERVGNLVTGFKPGDRVFSDTCVSCGHCPACQSGRKFNCSELRPLGTIHAWDGAFAEYILMPERHMMHLPDNVGFDAGAMIEPLTIAYAGVKAAGVSPGDNVLIQGSGVLGIMAARLAAISGAAGVFITGRKPGKLALAERFSGATTINTTHKRVKDILEQALPEGKVDKVIETSGSLELLKDSFNVVVSGGTVSSVAFYEASADKCMIDRLVFGNLSFHGVSDTSSCYAPVVKLLASGKIDPTMLITGRYCFSDILTGYSDMAKVGNERIKLMLEFGE